MGKPVVHWEIIGRDGERLQRFYTELFGWKVNANNPMKYGLVDTGGEGGINGGIAAAEDGHGVTFYVQVGDLQAALDRAESLGGRTLTSPTEIPNMVTFAVFADPEGNRIGLVKG